MPRKGLSRERVVEAAAEWIDRHGAEGFSMRALAESLNIKTASLYNHVESMERLLAEVCAYGLRMQRDEECRAIAGKANTEAIRALADAYRSFAKEHSPLYRLIIQTAASLGERLGGASGCIIEPFMQVLEGAPLTETEKTHWQRTLRAVLHGFVAQEDAGFFAHLPAAAEESFHTAVGCYIDGLTQAIRRKQA